MTVTVRSSNDSEFDSAVDLLNQGWQAWEYPESMGC